MKQNTAASSPANSKAATLLWGTKRAVILLEPLRSCSPRKAPPTDLPRRRTPLAARPGTVPSQWLRRFRAMLRSPNLRARMPDTSSFSVRATLRDATPKGALAARGKPPAQAKPGVGGEAAWQLCVETNRTSPSCDKPCGGCPQSSGMDCSGATKISSICRRCLTGNASG